jgi:hypothetical protein
MKTENGRLQRKLAENDSSGPLSRPEPPAKDIEQLEAVIEDLKRQLVDASSLRALLDAALREKSHG